ncbi:MAG: hypothetical protein HYU57_03900 [Micavibrio aeruginosavorus]|nr:hypothetical protein [Micavibrio aeruginosavorus]
MTSDSRVTTLHALYDAAAADRARTNSRDILKADFGGDWPPRGLAIAAGPDIPVEFRADKYFSFFVNAHVDNSEHRNRIHINRFWSLTRAFNKASFADTLAHENIHILQKDMMRSGITDPFGRNRRYGTEAMIGKSHSAFIRYLAAEDEIQARLHEVTAHHYRDVLAMLHCEGVAIDPVCIRGLSRDQAGRAALAAFSVPSYPKTWLAPEVIRDLNSVIRAVPKEKRISFCNNVIPALYGGLLELYGDREGSRRMGAAHNIVMTDRFFRQAWRLQHALEKKSIPSTAGIEAVINAMPESQAADLLGHITRQESFKHPLSGRELKLNPQAAALVAPLFLKRGGPDAKGGLEENGPNPYTLSP